jgi:tetratricopeptide (TPR) repeat protein
MQQLRAEDRPMETRALVVLLWLLCSLPVHAAASTTPPRFDGLGDFTRPISTRSTEAQAYFDQGLAFLYAFNHDEAVRAFRYAAELDPRAAMPHWGIAVALGPHINNMVVTEENARSAWTAVTAARARLDGATAVERALVDAQATRFADPPPADRGPLDRAYAEAMRTVWKQYPRDADVGALYAEALADLQPWDLWTVSGEPRPGTQDLIAVLDAVLAVAPKHPLANHLYIHALEASPEPARADAAAEVLRDLQPGLGHMVHMPSHIDVRRARWQQAIDSNTRAIAADEAYTARSPDQGFYRLYMSHNRHMLSFAAMMNGRSALALSTIRAMVDAVPPEVFRTQPWADGMMVMPLEVMMRFGRWEEILATPPFPEQVPLSRALQHYARAVAYAATDRTAEAETERAAFAAARAKVPEAAFFGNASAANLLAIAAGVMDGEIAFRKGAHEEALRLLAQAAADEDKLLYDEPPDWLQPVRHPWGAALLKLGRAKEAEAVFRKDLERFPGNGWGLYGLMRALQLQERLDEAAMVEKEFDTVWAGADIKIKTPCLCLPGV